MIELYFYKNQKNTSIKYCILQKIIKEKNIIYYQHPKQQKPYMEKQSQRTKLFAKTNTKNDNYELQTLKGKKKLTTLSQNIDIEVRQCIQKIIQKMQNAKIQTLHPPYFQKTLTKFRQQNYSIKLQPYIKQKLSSLKQQELKSALNKLSQFITNFDDQYVDTYSEQIRQPYIRKIFNQGYQIDKVNFKKLNTEYQLRKQIQEVLNQTSQWLIQLEILQDVLSRIQLYFGIKTQTIMEKLKTEGADNRKGSWSDYFASLIKKATSYALRKGSRVVQNTGYASVLSPAFAMLTWAIIGGSSTLPWKGGIDVKSLIVPLIAFTVPYMLDNMAQTIQRSDFKALLQNWAQQFQKINDSLRHFNQMLIKQIEYCSKAQNRQQYSIHLTNLQKYVSNLSKQIQKVSNYHEQTFQQMRQSTKAYFMNYIQQQDGQWTVVMTPEQYQKYHKNKKQDQK